MVWFRGLDQSSVYNDISVFLFLLQVPDDGFMNDAILGRLRDDNIEVVTAALEAGSVSFIVFILDLKGGLNKLLQLKDFLF